MQNNLCTYNSLPSFALLKLEDSDDDALHNDEPPLEEEQFDDVDTVLDYSKGVSNVTTLLVLMGGGRVGSTW